MTIQAYFADKELLLTGVTINSICMAAILFLHYTAGLTQSFAIVRWLMGGIESMPLEIRYSEPQEYYFAMFLMIYLASLTARKGRQAS